jgi:type III pantothenate kinase
VLLTLDIGNTNITAGLFTGKETSPRFVWRMATHRRVTSDEAGMRLLEFLRHYGLSPGDIRGVAVASVVPPLDDVFRAAVRRYFGSDPLLVGPSTPCGVRNLYANPLEVGADRLVNAAAARARIKGPCIVVDFGTATTFDCVGPRGDYRGGVIAPGPLMAAEALAQRTAKLPHLATFQKPPSPLGRTTLESLQSGLFYGYVGLTREIVNRLAEVMGKRVRVIATGGVADRVAPWVPAIEAVHPHLTLEGLRIVWQINRG